MLVVTRCTLSPGTGWGPGPQFTACFEESWDLFSFCSIFFVLWLSHLRKHTTAFPSWMLYSLFERCHTFLHKINSNLCCRVLEQTRFFTTFQPTCTYLFSMWFSMKPVGIIKFSPSARETLWFSWSSLAGVSFWVIFLSLNLQLSLKLTQANVHEHSPDLQLNPSSCAWPCWITHSRDELKLNNSGIQLLTHTSSRC